MNMAQIARREAAADKQQSVLDAWTQKVAKLSGITPDEDLALAMFEDGFSVQEAATETQAQAVAH